MRIGFLINPIAGMGGRVGLKGTDGVVEEAIRLGAEPVAPTKAAQTLRLLRKTLEGEARRVDLQWVTCSGAMGEDALRKAGFDRISILHETSATPTARDTAKATYALVQAGIDLILFCGGDGTARDITRIAGEDVPVLGIPSGVKMYSGVFGVTPARTAEIIVRFVLGELPLAKVDIVDLDEEKYRKGEWSVRLFCSAATPYEPSYTQSAKALISASTDASVKSDIAEYLGEEIGARAGTLFILGPGSTVQTVAEHLGVRKALLGIDAVLGGETVGHDLNEQGILKLLERHPAAELILSPIGAQGFVLGRGNLQISPAVVRKIGLDRLTVIATSAKLKRTPVLRFDTGDQALDEALASRGYLSVITGYRRRRLTPICR
jgi:predicted polyphosphate/ATP-dependent NAD kinase